MATGRRKEILAGVALLASVLDSKGAVYCSAPITSGRRFQRWLHRTARSYVDVDNLERSLSLNHARDVIVPNTSRARAVARRLRKGREIVIDPTAVPLTARSWRQTDWRMLWEEVVRRYARRVVFVDDWAYSNGCAHEFLVAIRGGIPAYDEQNRRLSLNRGLTLIRAAVVEIEDSGRTAAYLKQVLTGLLRERKRRRARARS